MEVVGRWFALSLNCASKGRFHRAVSVTRKNLMPFWHFHLRAAPIGWRPRPALAASSGFGRQAELAVVGATESGFAGSKPDGPGKYRCRPRQRRWPRLRLFAVWSWQVPW